MDTSSLAGLIFFLAFAGMILVHELGHYLASRLFGVEVEEFGFGIPPRAWRFWRLKGSLTVGPHTLVIPANYDLPFDPQDGLHRGVEIIARRDDERLVLEHISALAATEDGQYRISQPEPVEGRDGKLHFDGILHKISQGTEFTLNWLPLGGFVRPKGENDPTIEGGLAAANPWKRLGVLIAGPLMNLITAVIVFGVIFNQGGIPSQVRLIEVMPDSPASQAGLQPGDIILSANGKTMNTIEGMRILIRRNLDHPITLVIERNNETMQVVATPLSSRYSQGAMGILMEQGYEPASNWFAALPASLEATSQQSYEVLSLPAQMIRGLLAPEEGRFIGLKGIFDIFNLTVSADIESRAPSAAAEAPTYATLNLIAVLSISIGLFNLLPFPALDGGRITFVIPEIILRRRVPHQFENAVHAAGMLFLILLMVYVNLMDFINPIDLTR